MLAPQPIPVWSLVVCAGRFLEGAGEVEEVWPFTSKVWAALAVAVAVAMIKTANRTELLNTKLLNAEATISPARR
jgi:hypothetical protein